MVIKNNDNKDKTNYSTYIKFYSIPNPKQYCIEIQVLLNIIAQF